MYKYKSFHLNIFQSVNLNKFFFRMLMYYQFREII